MKIYTDQQVTDMLGILLSLEKRSEVDTTVLYYIKEMRKILISGEEVSIQVRER